MLKRFYRVWTCFWRFVRTIISHADLNQMVELNLRIQCYWFWIGETWTGPIIFAMFFATHGPTRSSRWKSHWPGRLLWAWAQAKMAWMSLPKCNMFFWIEIDRLHPLIRWLQNVWNPHSNQSLYCGLRYRILMQEKDTPMRPPRNRMVAPQQLVQIQSYANESK